MASPVKIVGRALLAVSVVVGWAALQAGASMPYEQQITILEIKDRALNVSRMAAQMSSQALDPQTKVQASAVAIAGRKLFDRAEKVLHP